MLLTSHGLRTPRLRDTLVELLGMPTADARIAVVIDAILPFADDKSTLLEHLNELHGLGWAEFDVISLLAAPRPLAEERLRSAHVVLGYGGSNVWLAHAWTSTGLAELLLELLEQKVYVGWSAGSMIFSSQQAAAVAAFEDDEVERFGLGTTAPAVELFEWFLMPHLDAEWAPDQDDAWAARSAARLGGPIWFLDDETALVVRDPAVEPQVVSTGRWLRFDASGALVSRSPS